MSLKFPAKFDHNEAEVAYKEWGFNCGPGAVCGLLGMTPSEVRPHMGNFEKKKYTDPLLMLKVLQSLGKDAIQAYSIAPRSIGDTTYALVRIQWGGPWTAPGVPLSKRQRHTHWIACVHDWVWDINAIRYGGWLSREEWETKLVPWLIKQVEPEGDGTFWPTHVWEIVE